jgi:ABC-2 type transport system ATP-binding protein
VPDYDIQAEGLERSFHGDVVVDKVNVAVTRGAVFACVGPLGAGRTPLIRMLCGLLAPNAGKAKVAGYDLITQTREVRKRVGAVISGNALDPGEGARDALRFQGRLRGLTGSLLDARVNAALEVVRLGKVGNDPIGKQEPATRRRLEVAAALVHGPQVLFLDEATAGLDKPDAGELLSDIRDAQRAMGMTVFMATQVTAEAEQIADRVGIMLHGRIVAEGDLHELKASVGGEIIALHVEGSADEAARVARTVGGVSDVVVNGDDVAILADGPAAVLSPLASALAASGVATAQLALRRATLDDVFLELTGKHIERMGGRATMAFPTRS